ncbi:unnamed protein product [Lota lota]
MQETILLFLSLSGLFLGHHASLPISKFYYYVDQKLSWTDAQQHCREQNGDLATVDDLADLQHLQESRTGFNYDNDFMWIGLYDDRTSWTWSLGNQDYKFGQHYGNWANMEPDFWYCEENCTKTNNVGQWTDTSCYQPSGALCFDGEGHLKQRSTFKLNISSEADMTVPEVERQILEQLYVKLAEEGLTGINISWVLKDGQVFHEDQPSKT